MKVLVTGATGFVGRVVCSTLLKHGCFVRGTYLQSESPAILPEGVEPVLVQPLGGETPWEESLLGIDVVIHLAARVHIMDDSSANPLADFRRVNVAGTAGLAREAASAGVKRFVFVSSIKVNGEESVFQYTQSSPASPTDPYGVSKWEAEQELRGIEVETGMGVVVVRPTLVYGPGVKANFLNLMKVVSRGVPLPLGSIANRRSFIYVENLADALVTCAVHPTAAGKTFLVSDGEDISTPELIRLTAVALGVPTRLIPFPVWAITLAGRMLGKSGAVNRLTGSLAVDYSGIKTELGWKPPFSMEEGLRETARWFKSLADN
jgi:Nucleoside-diphosphate-sugar epimerases